MKSFLKPVLLTLFCLTALMGCYGEEEESDDSSSGSGGSSGSGSSDALDYPQVTYSFTCPAPVGGSHSVDVSNGPCISQQKSYSRATSCNLVGDDYTFNYVGKPFYQCLVNNSSGDYKKYYQQYLTYYSLANPNTELSSIVAKQQKPYRKAVQLDESFTSPSSADAWTSSSINLPNSHVTLSLENGALNIALQAPNNLHLVETFLLSPADLNGSTLSVDIYLPESYLRNGHFVQLYIEDDLGNLTISRISDDLLKLWMTSGSDGWLNLSYTLTQSGVTVQSNQEFYSNWESPFDVNLSKITSVGFVFEHGVSVENPVLKIDNVVLP
ncbi:MAG: hypothetical protein IPK77_13635 [Cellvibrio sp.]|nr:hypothetical protein [Cellvibrio sp.]